MDRQAIQERFGIIGTSSALRRVLDRVRQVARTDISVLLEGESGSGKELFATLIHELSARRGRPFVVVNCGAIPEGLIEAELFGAEKGAYTGSIERRTGYFEEADRGTIFLDEIGEMPLQAQVRLLRVLESGTFSRVGSSQQQRVDVRVVAATNKDLAVEVREGRFREDLYYRLSTVVVRVPPVRERPDDVLPLFEHFMVRAARRYDAPLRRLEPDARDLLGRYNWPGNVRELRNVAEQAAVLARGETISAEELRPLLRGVSAAMGLAPTTAREESAGLGGARERELIYRALLELRLELREVKELLRRGAAPPTLGGLDPGELADGEEFAFVPEDPEPEEYHGLIEDVPYEIEGDAALATELAALDLPAAPDLPTPPGLASAPPRSEEAGRPSPVAPESALRLTGAPLPTMEEAEQALIAEALRRFGGNRRQTAKALGISERTLYRKLKDLEHAGVEVS